MNGWAPRQSILDRGWVCPLCFDVKPCYRGVYGRCERELASILSVWVDGDNAHYSLSLSAVPFCMHSPPGHSHKFRKLTHDPGLSDVAPTVLDLMGLDIPPEMSGQSLITK
jgi:2,3-bisphosphoglycerate-independent phosphoglycerate mutase